MDDNEFIVSRQVIYHGMDDIRTDIMLYINGIPLVEIECKNPASFSENWFDAYKQIKDYEKTVPELYKYVQIGIAAEQTAMYFPIVPWQEELKANQWKEGDKDPLDSTIAMLSKYTLLDIIRNFMFFRVEMGNATKVIARYMQYRAARKIVNRPRVTMTELRTGASSTGLSTTRSSMAPMNADTRSARKKAGQKSMRVRKDQAMNVLNIAISPCAKFTTLVER